MANTFYERPILNSPYEKPRFHHPSMITVSRSGCRRSKRAGHRSSSFRFRRRGAGQRGHRAHRHSQPTATARSSARSAARRSRCAPPLGGSAPKPVVRRVPEPRFGFEVACFQRSMRCRASTESRCQRPSSDTLKALAAVFRADSNSLSLVRKDRPAGGHSGVWRPTPKIFAKF